MSALEKRDPIALGTLIVQTLIIIFWFSSVSGISPINNSTITNSIGCSTCGPNGGVGGLWFSSRFLIAALFIVMMPAAMMQGLERMGGVRGLDDALNRGVETGRELIGELGNEQEQFEEEELEVEGERGDDDGGLADDG